MQNITISDLLLWSLPVNKIERYQKYLDEKGLNSIEGLETIYNCSSPWFGSYCEYSFEFDFRSFTHALEETFWIKTNFANDPNEILRVTNGGTCYEQVECSRVEGVCLDWREICDGKCDCFNDCRDEKECWQLEENECQTDEFRCRNGQCVTREIMLEYGNLMGCLDKSELNPLYWTGDPDIPEVDDCQLSPFLHCEDSTCSKFASQFACGDGQCLDSFPAFNNHTNTTVCQNGRDLHLLKAMLNISRMNLSEECWQSMICALQFEHVYSFECSNVSEPAITCLGDRLLVFPSTPILFNHIYFVYDLDHLHKISPNFICYDPQFCEFPSEQEQVVNNSTCISFNQTLDQWSDLTTHVRKLFHSYCWSQYQKCFSPITQFECQSAKNSSKCISKHRLLDGQRDCSLNEDELHPNSCSLNLTSRFFCGHLESDRCVSQILFWDGNVDCPLTKRDESVVFYVNQYVILGKVCNGYVNYILQSANKNITDEQDCENSVCLQPEVKCNLTIDDFKPYPPLNVSKIYHQPVITITHSEKETEQRKMLLGEDYYRHAWYCNTGVLVGPEEKCFCPPSYYGDRCQFQSQRINLAILVRKLGVSEREIAFRLVLQLIDSTEDGIVVAQEQLLYIKPEIPLNCDGRFETQLLYPHRSKLLNHTYFIRINAYAVNILKRQEIQYRATWYSSIPFPFLPVNKLALYLVIPTDKPQTVSCDQTNACIHGECVYYANSSQYFCRCHSGWTGRKCDRGYHCQCSPDSICVDGPTNCACPIGKFGSLCYITYPTCNKCKNGATCIVDSQYSINEPYCFCPEEFDGYDCQSRRSSSTVSFNPRVINEIPSSVLIHFISIYDFPAVISRQTTFTRIAPLENSFRLYFRDNINFILIEFNRNYHLILLRRNKYFFVEEPRENVSVMIDSTNKCSSISEFLNQTILSSPQITRFKYYHEPCQVNLDLKCFYDERQMCLCHQHYHTAACFDFDHDLQYDCTGINYCKNNGKCFQDDQKCPSKSVCVCGECFYGSLCQLTTSGFVLSLDSIIGYLIRPKLMLEKQSGIIKLAVALTTVMLAVGLLLNSFAICTFIQKKTLETGVGFYLLGSSVVSLLTMIVFSLKFYTLLATQMALITNITNLNVSCKVIEYLLKCLPPTTDWLNACVAIERTTMVVMGVRFNNSRSIIASKFIVFLVCVFTIISAIHDPLNRQVIYDEEEGRTWCVVSYLYWPTLHALNSALNIIHFIVPFAINFISAFVIILMAARKRSLARTQQTYGEHLREQFQQHRHLILSPCILVLLALPRLIISFFTGCMQSQRNPWLYFSGYFISYIPPMTTFVIFVLPSEKYKVEFMSALKRFYVRIK